MTDTETQLRRAQRRVIVAATYRSLVTFALLAVGFDAFADHKAVFALAVIAFNTGMSSLALVQSVTFTGANLLHDVAERKTRHTIMLAQQLGAGGVSDDDHFWVQVDRRVEAELEQQREPKPGPLEVLGATLGSFVGWLVSDIVLVVVAWFASPFLSAFVPG